MTDKIRVKDLADELHMSTKEVLGIIKELSIQARASNSVLANEEIIRIKDRIRDKQNPEGGPERKDNVIVRRRRSDGGGRSAGHEPAVQDLAQDASEEDSHTEATASDQQAKPAARQEKTQPAKPVVSGNARIVSRPTDPAPEPQTTPDVLEKTAPPKIVQPVTSQVEPQVKIVQAASEKIETASDETVLPETSAESNKAPVKTETAEVSQTEPTAKDAAAVTPKDQAPHDKRTATIISHAKPNEQAPSSGTTSGVRIISRPSAQQPQPARPAYQQDRRGTDAGASPSGGGRYDRDGRAPGRGAASPRPQATDGRGDTRTNQGGAPRPASPRPTSPRPGAPRPGAPRPAGAGRPGPGADMFAPSAEADARNKKRTKGKRTVDFATDSFDRLGKGGEGDDSWMRNRRNKGRKGKQDVKPTATQPLKAAKRKIRMEEGRNRAKKKQKNDKGYNWAWT